MIEPASASAAVGAGVLAVGGHLVEADLAPDRHTVDGQALASAVVGLHQRADGEAALLGRQAARGRADAALEAVADHAGAAADVALGDGPARGVRKGRVEVLGADVLAVDVVEPAVPGLAHHRQRPGRLRRSPH